MSLPHALMVSLLEKSSSGYDLAQRFGKSIGYFWQATHQQIYRELAKMESLGWLNSEADPESKTKKRLYAVLPAGEAELRRWAMEQQDPPPQRDAFFIRLRADAIMDGVDLAPELLRRMQIHEDKLKIYRMIEQRDFAEERVQSKDTATQRELRVQHLILSAGIRYEEGCLAWAKEAHDLLIKLAKECP